MNVYEIVTNKLLEELKKGIIPWKKAWIGKKAGTYNRITKKNYSLLNQILLKHSGEYASFKQWQSLGGTIKKGEKAEQVFFWKPTEIEETDKDGKIIKKTIPILKYYNVFHISQVDGVEPLDMLNKDLNPIEEIDELLDDYVNRENISLIESDNYTPTFDINKDEIIIPSINRFKNIDGYYKTIFNYCIKSTSTPKRLNRIITDYSKEVLIDEIGSSSILSMYDLNADLTSEVNKDDIDKWIDLLSNDNKLFISAAGKAEKAVNYILGE